VSSDEPLIARSLAGDSAAFGELVLRHQDRLFNALAHLLGSPHDAADVAQDAFVLAYRNLSSFQGKSAFYSWLFRIAYNAAVNFRRRERSDKRSVETRRQQSGEEPVDGRAGADPGESLQTDERRRAVQTALSEMADDYRCALVLKEIEGLPYEQIAEVMQCPVGTVRSRIHRARQEMRGKLERALRASEF
jgi:RNA polymerase sigma-70 factor (ECF subfamily)